MAAALAIVGTAFLHIHCKVPDVSLADCQDADVGLPRAWALATVVGLMTYVSGYQVGFGPITWLIISEVFPLRVRGSALSVAAIMNFGFNILVTFSTASLLEAFPP